MQRNRPYVNFRPTQEVSDEVTALGTKTGLTNAEIARQLFLCGLKDLHEGKFSFDRRPLLDPLTKKGSGRPDKRHNRKTGEKIVKARMKRKGGKEVILGENTMQSRPETTPALPGVTSNE